MRIWIGLAADLIELAIVPILRSVQREEAPRAREIFAAVGDSFKSTNARAEAEAVIEIAFGERSTPVAPEPD